MRVCENEYFKFNVLPKRWISVTGIDRRACLFRIGSELTVSPRYADFVDDCTRPLRDLIFDSMGLDDCFRWRHLVRLL